ncbi:hypothetical protein ABAC402_15450 [Asticcacaulis sp. AC402]|nr:hypothetical protein ABAC402_15450 [Asticcacaulis sp. AC402]
MVAETVLYTASEYYKNKQENRRYAFEEEDRFDDAYDDFYGRICDDVTDQAEVVIAANRDGVKSFRHFVENSRPNLAPIVSFETTPDLDDGQFAIFIRDSSSHN